MLGVEPAKRLCVGYPRETLLSRGMLTPEVKDLEFLSLKYNFAIPSYALAILKWRPSSELCGAESSRREGAGRQDYFDVSLVDGFNLPVSITPQGGSGPICTTSSCAENANSVCPSELATCQPTDYSKIFKNKCPQAYSYVYGDQTSTFSCTDGPDYQITFCP
ncbi:hypothetical protein PTKIN_Ptkin10aG0162100 [Pterospermum kingtungense]